MRYSRLASLVGSCEVRSPVYKEKSRPVCSVPVSTGMASKADAAREYGVSLVIVQ